MNDNNFEIDLVYLWVDGSEEKWLAKKNTFLGVLDTNTQVNCKGRTANNDELKFSLRSAEKFASWIRKIFIVVDNQTPDWLDISNPKIQLVDIVEILPKDALPCYNSVVIEYFLYKIPDLSEHFLYANDDMFFNADVQPDFFFNVSGYPIVRMKRKPFAKWNYKIEKLFKKELSVYKQTLVNAADLVERKFNKYYSGKPHHNIDAYLKSDYQTAIEEVFKNEVTATVTNHLRSRQDIQRMGFLYYALAIEHGQLKYVTKQESCVVRLQRKNYQHYFDKYHPKLVCVNDSERVSDSDRTRMKNFLKNLFPHKSKFEL
ncbi:MAG: Stealth CR1 domain-containing protein [Prevotellaceae bacterium]|jgi:hypothetical protein|nr:Stealth CR1 domain-containing protein [Prevotellaceae bacterium]